MGEKTDLRVSRTEKMLRDAFIEMMEDIGFKNITIEALTKKAYISRKTFYLHYLDKYDLLDKLEENVINGVGEIIQPLPAMIQRGNYILGEEVNNQYIKLYQFFYDNSRLINLLNDEKNDPEFMDKIAKKIRSNVKTGYPEGTGNIPGKYFESLFSSTNAGVIRAWYASNMQETPVELAGITSRIVQGILDSLILSNKEYAADSSKTEN